MLVVDTAVAIVVNALVFPLLLLAAGLPPPRAIFGADGALLDAVLATICPVVLMTILMTLVLRARFRRQVPADAHGLLPRFPRLPAAVIIRSFALAIVALVLLVPVRLTVIESLGMLPMNTKSHLFLNMFHGCLIGIVFMTVIFVGTLAEFRDDHAAPPGEPRG
jgi:hypothetical protein